MQFVKATKRNARLRMALVGPAGSGKTYTALAIATHLGERVAVLDTERGSASKYADLFPFDVLELERFHPQHYIDAIDAAASAGYSVLVIDSLSHAWMGKDGALELVDRASARNKGNAFGAWREVTPLHNALVDALIGAPLHIIATMRTKTEYVHEKDEKTGRTVVRKLGLQPVQRDGLEYEFDVVGDLTKENELVITKTRCPSLKGLVIPQPGEEVAGTLSDWLAGAPARDVLVTQLHDLREQVKERGHLPRPLTKAQVAAMSAAELEAEVKSVRQLLAA